MKETVVTEVQNHDDDEDSCFEGDSRSSTDTEEFLDLADLDDFMDTKSCAVPVWKNEKLVKIEKTIDGSRVDVSSIRELCLSQGGLLTGMCSSNYYNT